MCLMDEDDVLYCTHSPTYLIWMDAAFVVMADGTCAVCME